ncbi:MAG: folate-binding protein, partial [Burkholderiaceae bacterium]
MEQWLQFLAQQGAEFGAGPAPEVLGFGDAGAGLPAADFVAPLTGLGLIAASGDEAAHFLHNQLTNDVEHLGTDEARLAGYCTPKGRLLATMLIWNRGDAILLQMPRAILPPLQKRLQMFVLRAKVKLADASDQYAILGLAGARAGTLLGRWFDALPAAPYGAVHGTAGTLI